MKCNVYVFLMLGFAIQAFGCSKKNDPGGNVTITGSTHVYYVAANGLESNKGTIDAPFQTINNALSHTIPGDTVMVRGGVYSEKVVFPKSGVMDKYITLKAYRGETPIIDGSAFSVNGREALVTIDKAKYIVVDGFEIRNLKTATGDPKAIMVEGGSDYIIIKNNTVYGIDYTQLPLNGGGNAILVIGNTTDPVTNITVTGNTIHDCKTGYGENLTINGYVDGFTITNNTIYNAQNIGIDAAGGYAANSDPTLNYARNGVISGNTLYNIESKRGPLGGHGAIGIYVDGGRNVVVEKNKVSVTDRGIGVVSETNGFPTDHVTIRNNLVFNCWCSGIYMGGYLNYTGGGTSNSAIVNNTLYNNNQALGAFGEIEGEISIREDCTNNVIKNNIIYGGASDMFIHKYTNRGSGNIIDYNLYYTTGPAQWTWNGVAYTDYNLWKTACGGDASSTYGTDPLFVNTSGLDFHLQSSSVAKNSGQVISDGVNGTVDFDGNTRIVNKQISKGAYQ
ncbi:right-handed parallel beta-helix repeat-containing protein [Mucilaginibacter gossypii]|uniref:right-handed parallel beta-helix repeat-containing protein n=1 Tax=Mucilaginibacter gossypii TaxID=551996 RepID=UPI001673AFDC|nr:MULTISPECIES: right-handed parallel beta-helix repeat-containing protein [Mucilaginibacter]QTE39634.1 right-handed parallel beta-helix repeat-containing protein [Mucilaginibacter gossypii]